MFGYAFVHGRCAIVTMVRSIHLTVSWFAELVKTTLDLPSDLVKQLKLHAVLEGRKMKDIVATFIAEGLASRTASVQPQKGHIALPLFPSKPGARACEMTMEEIIAADQEILSQQDLEHLNQWKISKTEAEDTKDFARRFLARWGWAGRRYSAFSCQIVFSARLFCCT